MSGRFSSLSRGAAPVVLALAGLLSRHALAQSGTGGRAIEFSGPKSSEVTNNLRHLSRKADGLKQIEESLHKPARLFEDDEGSLAGTLDVPLQQPAPTAAQSRRAREMEDRRKNWIFMTPDEFVAAAAKDGNADGSDDREYEQNGQPMSLMEKYYLKDDQTTSAKRNLRNKSQFQDRFGIDSLSGYTRGEDEPGALNELSASEKALKKLLNSKPDTAAAANRQESVFADIFGLGESTPSKEEMMKHKALMQQFQQILDPGWQPPAGAFANPANVAAGTSPAGLGSFSSLPQEALPQSGLAPSLSGTLPTMNPAASLPSLTAQPPKPQPVDLTPPTPNFQAPRRPF